MFLAADLRAAMRTGVQHRLQISLAVAGEQDASAPDLTGDEIAGLGKLGTVTEIEPAFVEDLGPFDLQNGRIDEGLTGNLEDLPDSSIRSAVFIGPIAFIDVPPLINCFSMPVADRMRAIQYRIGRAWPAVRPAAGTWPCPWQH